MAWRDGKASGRKLVLFMLSIVLGIAAVVSIQSFGENLKDNINAESKELMGADFIIDSDQKPNERVQAIIDSLGGPDAEEVNFASMVAFPNGATKLVRVRGIQGDFPFYGKLETIPDSAAATYQNGKRALVDATVMAQFNVQPGDSIKVGTEKFEVAGKLKSVPGRTAVSTTIAPPVFIPRRYLEETGLIQQGSRLEYEYYFVAEPEQDMKVLDEELDPILDAQGADLDTHSSTGRRMGDNYDNFGKFLNLVAFIALLLGCVGIASSIDIYIREKLRSVAVLRCVGASRRQTFLIFLIQIAGMGLLGGIIGVLGGVGLQQLFPMFVQEFLPVDVEVALSGQSIIMGLILGVVMSVLFALIPLTSIWNVSPLQALRVSDEPRRGSRKARNFILLGITVFIFLFSLWLLDNWLYSLAFVGGLLVTFAILAGIASLLMKGVKRYFPHSWGFVPRQSLLNLFRPQNQTLILMLAIGVGAFLISTLYFTKDFLLEKVNIGSNDDPINMVVFDVQSGQKEEVAETIRQEGLEVVDRIPIVTMRLHSIKGEKVSKLRNDTTTKVDHWVLNHEFRVTYRDTLTRTESIAKGEWRGKNDPDQLYISVDENFAGDARVDVGDTVVFNVQGVLMDAVIGSIREVDWARMSLNFSVVFPTGVLEDAPQFHVVTTNVPDEQVSAQIQQKLVGEFPNVSIIDMRQMLILLEDILNRISWVISFMAFFSILTGIIVLIGAVKTSKYQRIKESVLLRTIGAHSSQVLRITALEYFYLGVLGSLAGILLSLVSSFLLAYFAFDAAFTPSYIPFAILFPGITVLVVLIGLSNSRTVIKSPPLEVLRKET